MKKILLMTALLCILSSCTTGINSSDYKYDVKYEVTSNKENVKCDIMFNQNGALLYEQQNAPFTYEFLTNDPQLLGLYVHVFNKDNDGVNISISINGEQPYSRNIYLHNNQMRGGVSMNIDGTDKNYAYFNYTW